MSEQSKTVFEPAAYFSLKAAVLEIALKEEQARHILTTCALARHQTFTRAGLDPSQEYFLVDSETAAVAAPRNQG